MKRISIFLLFLSLLAVAYAGLSYLWRTHTVETGTRTTAEIAEIVLTDDGEGNNWYRLTFQVDLNGESAIRSRKYKESLFNRLDYKQGDTVNIYYNSNLDPHALAFVVDGEEQSVRIETTFAVVGILLLLLMILWLIHIARKKKAVT